MNFETRKVEWTCGAMLYWSAIEKLVEQAGIYLTETEKTVSSQRGKLVEIKGWKKTGRMITDYPRGLPMANYGFILLN